MNITKNYLKREYFERGLDTPTIARKCGVKTKRILYLMTKFGLPRRTKFQIGSHSLEGKVFGKLKVLKRTERDNSKRSGSYWDCQCKCGKKSVVKGTSLVGGFTKSCGCLWKSASYQEISGEYLWNLKNNAKKRNLCFGVTSQYLWDLYLSQNKKCALSGEVLKFGDGLNNKNQTASLDRIDSSKGYEAGNVQWVHKDVNCIKTNMPQEVFLKWVFKIAHHLEEE